MPSSQPRTASRAERVAADLEAEILASRPPVGQRLGLRTELIDRFEVSPSIMNEALRLLRERGLITVKPGVNGGVFVAASPPHVRLGAIDLWFQGLSVDPVDLFESRMFLEDLFSAIAVDRIGPEDIRAAEWALDEMRKLRADPAGFLAANMRFHLAIARGTRVGMLINFYEALLAVLHGGIARATYTDGHETIIEHNLGVHAELLDAIRESDRGRLDKAINMHRGDMVRITDPTRSPGNPH
jgi:DNA-binding FadR family transcriptional regulator